MNEVRGLNHRDNNNKKNWCTIFTKGSYSNKSGRDNQKQSKIQVTCRSSYEQSGRENINFGTQRH